MKLNIFISVLASVIICGIGCRKKENNTPPAPTSDPVDSIVGTYHGTLRVIQYQSSYLGSSTSDTSYPQTYTFVKISADTFHTGTLYSTPTGKLGYDSSGVYPYADNGFLDTLWVFRSADSIYYHYYSWAPSNGGSSGYMSISKFFSGKR